MCIYCGTTKYRKIYENHHGPIPKEDNGRTYEIHHIDGNHSNNHPSNLMAITIQEHYDIHLKNQDYGACSAILLRMNEDPLDLSKKIQLLNLEKIKNGTHNFLGDKNPVYQEVKNGTHHLLKRKDGTSLTQDKIKNGTHNFLGDKNPVYKQLEINSHPFQKKINGSSVSSERVKNGTHNFVGENSITKMKWTCPHCEKSGKGIGNYSRYHGDKCKLNLQL